MSTSCGRQAPDSGPTGRRFPPWIRKRIPAGGAAGHVSRLLKGLRLETVCQNAKCPNQAECFARGTATFMIMGSVCTRNCRFCAVRHGTPGALDPDEPARVAEAAARLGLRHVVVTSVTRDDLPDQGSGHFRDTILALRERLQCAVEVLTPDFGGEEDLIKKVAAAAPAVYNHNLETVPRLYPEVRPQAVYARSLGLLGFVKSGHEDVCVKSGLMVGLGESTEEVLATMRDLRGAGCDVLTIGQYLQPSRRHLPVKRFVHPDEFAMYEREGERMGFRAMASGPFVRSSYNADVVFERHRSYRNL